MCVQVIMFAGNDQVDQATQTFFITEWSKKAVLELICKHYADWGNDAVHDQFEGDNTPIRESLEEAVPDRLFSGILEAEDGGQVYVVKVSP